MHTHEILWGEVGGGYINLLFQFNNIVLTRRWLEINRKYGKANVVLEDIPKDTPSSKVMGYLTQFMVSQDLSLEALSDRSAELAFMESVVQHLSIEITPPPPLENSLNHYNLRF